MRMEHQQWMSTNHVSFRIRRGDDELSYDGPSDVFKSLMGQFRSLQLGNGSGMHSAT